VFDKNEGLTGLNDAPNAAKVSDSSICTALNDRFGQAARAGVLDRSSAISRNSFRCSLPKIRNSPMAEAETEQLIVGGCTPLSR
jgi:hypothetical protein